MQILQSIIWRVIVVILELSHILVYLHILIQLTLHQEMFELSVISLSQFQFFMYSTSLLAICSCSLGKNIQQYDLIGEQITFMGVSETEH